MNLLKLYSTVGSNIRRVSDCIYEYFWHISEFSLDFVVPGGRGWRQAKLDKFERGVPDGGWLKRRRSVRPCRYVLR
jgi:hypothetical protein